MLRSVFQSSGMKLSCVCVLALAALCSSGRTNIYKKEYNADLSYKSASKRQRTDAGSSDPRASSAASSAGVTSESSSKVMTNLFISNKLSAKDAHKVQLAHRHEGNEHVICLSQLPLGFFIAMFRL